MTLTSRLVGGAAPSFLLRRPIPEYDGKGMTYEMDHVAPFLRFATSATLTMTTMPDMALAPGPSYDYVAEADAVIANMATVDTAGELDEIRFFDGKLNVALGLIGTLLLGYGQSIEEIMLHSFGETSAVHDAGVAVWKNKLLHSRIRPTTVIHELYPDDSLRLNDNMTVRGKHFQTIVRTMSHSEYPSGSAAVCAAIRDFVDALWPHLTLTMQGDEVSYSDAPFVILPNTAMATVPLTGAVNPAPGGLSAAAIAERCGATRELGGMHFSQSVPAGRKLAAGMGAEAAATLLSLLGPREGSVRQALGGSAPCAADCCAAAVECNATAQAICKARCAGRWDTPWFDVVLARVGALGAPSREAATEAPFFQADRNHIMIIGAMAGLVPAITDGYAFSFQTRFTNLVDQLVWNAFASNSERLQALLFGDATHRGVEPLVRSGHTSTDAKVVTAIHAIAAALPFFLPEAAGAFCAAPAPCFLLRPTIGLEPGLTAKCGSPLDGYPGVPMAEFDPEGGEWAVFPPEKAECLVAWHAEDAPGPSGLGQVVAFQLLWHRLRDGRAPCSVYLCLTSSHLTHTTDDAAATSAVKLCPPTEFRWNSMGLDGGCEGGPAYCLPYAEGRPQYNPQVGDCLEEELPASRL